MYISTLDRVGGHNFFLVATTSISLEIWWVPLHLNIKIEFLDFLLLREGAEEDSLSELTGSFGAGTDL